jgi:hypothetical protein
VTDRQSSDAEGAPRQAASASERVTFTDALRHLPRALRSRAFLTTLIIVTGLLTAARLLIDWAFDISVDAQYLAFASIAVLGPALRRDIEAHRSRGGQVSGSS